MEESLIFGAPSTDVITRLVTLLVKSTCLRRSFALHLLATCPTEDFFTEDQGKTDRNIPKSHSRPSWQFRHVQHKHVFKYNDWNWQSVFFFVWDVGDKNECRSIVCLKPTTALVSVQNCLLSTLFRYVFSWPRRPCHPTPMAFKGCCVGLRFSCDWRCLSQILSTLWIGCSLEHQTRNKTMVRATKHLGTIFNQKHQEKESRTVDGKRNPKANHLGYIYITL